MDQQHVESQEVVSKQNAQDPASLHFPSLTEEEPEQLGDDDEKFRKNYEGELASINRQCFAILQHLQSCEVLSNFEYHLYQFQNDTGKRLKICMPFEVKLTEVMQTPGYRAIREYCDAHKWQCNLTEVYHTGDA